mgnify:FL=1
MLDGGDVVVRNVLAGGVDDETIFVDVGTTLHIIQRGKEEHTDLFFWKNEKEHTDLRERVKEKQ